MKLLILIVMPVLNLQQTVIHVYAVIYRHVIHADVRYAPVVCRITDNWRTYSIEDRNNTLIAYSNMKISQILFCYLIFYYLKVKYQ